MTTKPRLPLAAILVAALLGIGLLACGGIFFLQPNKPQPVDIAAPGDNDNNPADDRKSEAKPDDKKKDDGITTVRPEDKDVVLSIQFGGTNSSRTQCHIAFFATTPQDFIEQHSAYSDDYREACVALGAKYSGGIWVPVRKKGAKSGNGAMTQENTDHWFSVYNFDEKESTLQNVIMRLDITAKTATVSFLVDAEKAHVDAIQPAVLKLVKAAGLKHGDKPAWKLETKTAILTLNP